MNNQDENEFELSGVIYVAIDDVDFVSCSACAFREQGTGCAFAPGCLKEDRADVRDVIFVEKQ